jgi:toxin YoeB
MSKYNVVIKEEAQADLKLLLRNEPKAYKKALKLIGELYEHPKTGTGHPEPLKGMPEGRWSRRITDKHRLVYRIIETEVYVDVLAAYGHYDDK